MLKKILFGLLAIIAIIAIAGLVIWNLPAENVAKKTVDYTISANELFGEYTSNEKAGNTKYIDKVLIVNGKIEDMMKDETGAQVVLISGSDIGNGVMCTLEESESAKAAQLKRGDEVSIKGRCSGMLMDVVLNKCTIQ